MSAPRKTDVKIGNRYGELIVLEIRRRPRNNGYTEEQAKCSCVCGKISWYSSTRLRQGLSLKCRSCVTSAAWERVPRLPETEIKLRIHEKNYRQGAIKRKLTWKLSQAEFRSLLSQSCAYCGILPANGVDRKDNSLGYSVENSVPCCAQCNYAKRHQTEFDFLNWVSRIAAKQGFSL